MYRIGCDIGGTFTDVVVWDTERGEVHAGKVLTTPDDPARAAIDGIRTVCAEQGIRLDSEVRHLIHGTTLVINTLIQRVGAKTALLVTEGFRDFLEVGRGSRYDNYDINIDMPVPLVPRRWRRGIRERVDAGGVVRTKLDERQARQAVRALVKDGVEAIAVCFLHSFRNPAHEHRMRELIRKEAPQIEVSLSCEVVPEIREYERASTTVANSFALPPTRRYLANFGEQLGKLRFGGEFLMMLSHGGITTPEVAAQFPIRILESGPAAGAVLGAFLGEQLNYPHILSFDMGGSTAKSCLIDDCKPQVTKEFEVARMARFKKGSGLPVNLPVIDMLEIGAGGGSIAGLDQMGLLTVGPLSAGAAPGPVCYGRGGTQPTVTDADLVLGYLDAGYFLGGGMALDRAAAETALGEQIAKPAKLTVLAAAWGVHNIVDENMANAARVLAVEKGIELGPYTMIAFGGAGPVHAFNVCRKLGIRRFLVPHVAGVASAFGFLVAPLSFDFIRTYILKLTDFEPNTLNRIYAEMEEEGRRLLSQAGVPREQVTITRSADMRYALQGREIDVSIPSGRLGPEHREQILNAFSTAHMQKYNWSHPDLEVMGVNWKIVAAGPRPQLTLNHRRSAATGSARKGERPVYFPEFNELRPCPVYDRYQLAPGFSCDGPAVIEERESTVVIGPGGTATVDQLGNVVVSVPTGAV
ncbi:MAG: hydantoinase/oxoprolinase family protein [Deltaproteobacteria bacterium]|nr:hydantoinase/oxoprolinase family protein [Deltaproteobacteria bacterium]